MIKPGRELDLLIADKIFGFVVKDRFFGEEKPITSGVALQFMSEMSAIPKYSSDISAAFEVVNKIKSLQPKLDDGYITGFQIRFYSNKNYWKAGFCGGDGSHEDDRFLWYNEFDATSEISAAHAICLAALRAKGIEIAEK